MKITKQKLSLKEIIIEEIQKTITEVSGVDDMDLPWPDGLSDEWIPSKDEYGGADFIQPTGPGGKPDDSGHHKKMVDLSDELEVVAKKSGYERPLDFLASLGFSSEASLEMLAAIKAGANIPEDSELENKK